MDNNYGFLNADEPLSNVDKLSTLNCRLIDTQSELKQIDKVLREIEKHDQDKKTEEILSIIKRNKESTANLLDMMVELQDQFQKFQQEYAVAEANPASLTSLSARVHGLEKNMEIVSTILLKNNLGHTE